MNEKPILTVSRPVEVQYPISSPFGINRDLTIDEQRRVRPHEGIDFAVPVGTPVHAMVDGTIFKVGFEDPNDEKEGLGLRVWQSFTKEGKHYFCWYAHLSQILVKEDQEIKKGQQIGISGCTGRATGPHLHVQFREVNTGKMLNAEFV